MSQSPTKTSSSREILQYDVAWAVLNQLIRSGRSFSGRERNCVFLNVQGERFANVSAATGLDLIDDGRGLALVDWDHDGDLDIWLTNRTGPRLRFLRNDMQTDHHFLALRLAGTTCNRDAIGARITLYRSSDDTRPLIKTLHAGQGFLSQSSKWIHFGLGADRTIDRVVILWPGGAEQTFRDLAADQRYQLVQGSAQARPWTSGPRRLRLATSTPQVPKPSDHSRVVLLMPVPLPQMQYYDKQGARRAIGDHRGKPLLVNLWTTTCRPCLVEMAEWKAHEQPLRDRGLQVLALCVEERSEQLEDDLNKALQAAGRIEFPFMVGVPDKHLVEKLEVVQRTFIGRQSPLPVPSSFLIDAEGRLAVIYKGPVPVERLLEDLKLLGASTDEIIDGAVPFSGRWLERPPATIPRQIAIKFVDGGYLAEAEAYLQQLMPIYERKLASQMDEKATEKAAKTKTELAELHTFQGAIHFDHKKFQKSVASYQRALQYDPYRRNVHAELVRAYGLLKMPERAAEHLAVMLKQKRDDPENLAKLANLKIQLKQMPQAIALYKEALAIKPDAVTHAALARILVAGGKAAGAIEHYQHALTLRKDFAPAANDLAWILATHPDAALRDGRRAVQLAEIANRASQGKQPSVLGTLAAAQAEAGQFKQAVETIRQAIELATAAGDEKTVEKHRAKRSMYESSRPYRDPLLAARPQGG